MYKRSPLLTCTLFLFVLLLASCKPDGEDPTDNNPTPLAPDVIAFHDVNPDTLIDHYTLVDSVVTYKMDLDQDNADDLQIRITIKDDYCNSNTQQAFDVYLSALHDSVALYYTNTNWAGFVAGDTIDANLTEWIDNFPIYLGRCNAPWVATLGRPNGTYQPLRFFKSGQYHYGYLHLEVLGRTEYNTNPQYPYDAKFEVLVMDWAVNFTPGNSIFAGQTQ